DNEVIYNSESRRDKNVEGEHNEDDDLIVEQPYEEDVQKEEPIHQQATQPSHTLGKGITIGKIVTALMIGMFVAILNQTLINVALPVMISDFNVSTATAQWLTTGFMLVNGILVPISAYMIQRFTYRQLFLTAMIFFTIGSL
ncbi:MFS transporter, partial [Klebsiella pneumoniae]|uniref:MFS transporter n=1 Tax=Klebsiella pneumoniae TaxID=573 RepID=UPI003C752796